METYDIAAVVGLDEERLQVAAAASVDNFFFRSIQRFDIKLPGHELNNFERLSALPSNRKELFFFFVNIFECVTHQ